MFSSHDLSLNQIPHLPLPLPSISQHLDLDVFKVYPCQKIEVHDKNKCPFFHSFNDKRRNTYSYTNQICELNSTCPLKDDCSKSHNKYEFLYHPNNYKMMFCKSFCEKEKCDLDLFCPYAHNENEIQGELLHDMKHDSDFYMFYYKTVFCPFIWKNHDANQCVYAHSVQELRRKPHLFEYSTKECSYFLNDQENICPLGRKCGESHGKMEVEFHPLGYKTMACRKKNCNGAENCPYAHDQGEMRFVYLIFTF